MANKLSKEKATAIACEYVSNGFDKIRALLACGYSQTYAKTGGHRLYNNVSVKAEIQRLQAKTELKTELKIMSNDELRAFWTTVVNNSNESTADRLRAGELLGRSRAMFTDNLNTTDTIRAAELTAEQEAEVRRFADIRIRQMSQEVEFSHNGSGGY